MWTMRLALSVAVCPIFALAAPVAHAAPIITSVGADLSSSPFTFNAAGSSFTFGFNGDFFGAGPVTIATADGGQVNTIFGQPTTYFVDRGLVSFGPSMQYAAFSNATPIRFTNGDNFIGLRAAANDGSAFYGFAFTTNNILNSFGFETVANTAITATTAVPAIPEPTTWAMMLIGFGAAGYAIRRGRKPKVQVSYAI